MDNFETRQQLEIKESRQTFKSMTHEGTEHLEVNFQQHLWLGLGKSQVVFGKKYQYLTRSILAKYVALK